MNLSRVSPLIKPLRDHFREARAADECGWPAELWDALVKAGGCRWGIPRGNGGEEWSAAEILEAAMELTRGDLTTTFIWTQFLAAIQRLEKAPPALRGKWLPRLSSAEAFATVGISHLTTSRKHGSNPAVQAVACNDGYRITGSIPWVTGLTRADVIVAGATVADGREILFALETSLPGVERSAPLPLLALQGSMTGRVDLCDVFVSIADVIAGPVENVLKAIGSGGAGSVMTSAVAAGHAFGAFDQLDRITAGPLEFHAIKDDWHRALRALQTELLHAADDRSIAAERVESLRVRSTTFALQMSQTLLTASKGAGFVSGHPAERFAREALFFLVWSCPQTVAGQLLHEFAQKPREGLPWASE